MLFRNLPKVELGSTVALVTSSGNAAALFPHVVHLAVSRIESEFGLRPMIAKHALNPNITLEQRAADLHEAFTDPEVKAIFSMIGGKNQASLIPLLKSAIFSAHPKPFFGFSDNTHLCNFLFCLGIPSFYGAAVLTQFGMSHAMHPETISGIRWALMGEGWFNLRQTLEFTEDEIDWHSASDFGRRRAHLHNEPIHFAGDHVAQGKLWGGCIETLSDLMTYPERLPKLATLEGAVLALETSEELPAASRVQEFMRQLGKMGYLERIVGIAHARPKAAFLGKPESIEARQSYRKEQRDIILDTARGYNKNLVFASNLDFGHTDPQYPLPIGGQMKIDPIAGEVSVLSSIGNSLPCARPSVQRVML